jgi:hypothetical protein
VAVAAAQGQLGQGSNFQHTVVQVQFFMTFWQSLLAQVTQLQSAQVVLVAPQTVSTALQVQVRHLVRY